MRRDDRRREERRLRNVRRGDRCREPEAPSLSEVVRRRLSSPAMNERKFAQVSRRELLKVAAGRCAWERSPFPAFQESLLKKGLGFSDWASARLFRRGHLAPTFADAELTPFEKFPINGYDVDDPGVIFENWTLTVSGAVQKPGDYKLAQIQALPRFRQNTRHVCVEGWDVIGRFGGARLSDFLTMIGADTSARFITVACADDYYESLDMATALHPQTLLCYEMYDQPLTREARRAAAAEYPDQGRIQAGEVSDRSEGHQRSGEGRVLGRSGVFVVLRAVREQV